MTSTFELWETSEHFDDLIEKFDPQLSGAYSYAFKDEPCITINPTEDGVGWAAKLSYFAGVDWVSKHRAVYAAPKLNNDEWETNYFGILFSLLKHPHVPDEIKALFIIKWDEPLIPITQRQDLLTPLLFVQFLSLVRDIVHKGLKKTYQPVERNLFARVKGKVMVNRNIKKNLASAKTLYNYCAFEEFSQDNIENRVLKRAISFIERYVSKMDSLKIEPHIRPLLNYIKPAFEAVSDDIDIDLIKHSRFNAFYKEYASAIHLAKFILKRFGYNITQAQAQGTLLTPPFWIDMSLLFELYVWGLLRNAGHAVQYQQPGNFGRPDYLIDGTWIADAKYKSYYRNPWINESIASDIRQVSGYSRDAKILHELGYDDNTVAPCLIFYPEALRGPLADDFKLCLDKREPIQGFTKIHKLAVPIPSL
jgi:5-methylcytosine-specific restriction enzyme subunit McrC